jgi:AraC family transcriptional regulator of adaptative response/methylated-DNA-[protein]-cysteine methyltransferase
MLAGAHDSAICLLEFLDRRMLDAQLRRLASHLGSPMVPGTDPVLSQLEGELQDYFEGKLWEFRVPLVTLGTEFQRKVWGELRRIPYGETLSYQELARKIGSTAAVRAVGTANGANRIAILLPCHRVVGSDGNLRGYGGGVWRKRWLLEHEQRRAAAGGCG